MKVKVKVKIRRRRLERQGCFIPMVADRIVYNVSVHSDVTDAM